jgi:hypothetical protein
MAELKRCYWMIRFIILKYNVFIDRAPCTKLHKRKGKDRTKTLAEFPNHVLKDYGVVQFWPWDEIEIALRGRAIL